MAEWKSDLQEKMLPDEELISFVTELRHAFYFVPHVNPDENYPPYLEATVALTNRRLIVRYWDNKVWKWFYTSSINSLAEREIGSEKPRWPYQAILMLPSGIGLVLETSKVDKEKQKELSVLLVQAFTQFGARGDDRGALTAIVAYEEEEEARRHRNRDDNYRKKEE